MSGMDKLNALEEKVNNLTTLNEKMNANLEAILGLIKMGGLASPVAGLDSRFDEEEKAEREQAQEQKDNTDAVGTGETTAKPAPLMGGAYNSKRAAFDSIKLW